MKKEVLENLFNENRAEWADKHFKEIFVEPTYLSKLQSIRPSVLIGGRGTGKTTALKSLRFDSTYERLVESNQSFSDQEFLGILIRMNKNRVQVFQGRGATEEEWQKLFAHYFNLLACKELVLLTAFLQDKTGKQLDEEYINQISIDLAVEGASNLTELSSNINKAISRLQIYVNNLYSESSYKPALSIAESPLKLFATLLKESGLLGEKTIFCCIDEYENVPDQHQSVLNTYIKHAERPLSYKVGVRKNGFRNKRTYDGQDLLRVPDDYQEIEIVDEGFDYFANAVANLRLKFGIRQGINFPQNIKEFLEELTLEEEAERLGAAKIAKDVKATIDSMDDKVKNYFKSMSSINLSFLKYWSEKTDEDIKELAMDWYLNEDVWKNRLNNHAYASLFWISKGNKGQRIRKYYCGERIFITLSSGNIRYFLELIDKALKLEIKDTQIGEGEITLSPKSQTLAAREVGKRRLNQLEGLADNGVQLKRLVLAIGKVFFEFARNPLSKSPETNSFILTGDDVSLERLLKLLKEGVGHLAFEEEPRTKATTPHEMKDEEFRLHRIFTGYFEISHRKKRRTTFDAKTLLQVIESNPAQAISKLIKSSDESVGSTPLQDRKSVV